MNAQQILKVIFFRTERENEPVRDWLRGLSATDKKIIGENIKLTQFRWPIGMPTVRKIDSGLWEIRSQLPNGRISRVFFTVHDHDMILLHGFEKKSSKTPKDDLDLAHKRKKQYFKETRNE